jgi:hypothetical protein
MLNGRMLLMDAIRPLVERAKRAIAAELPEDEPDTVPDWCYETIIAAALARSGAEEPQMVSELRAYLDSLTITSDNIGNIRRSLFVPWESPWNGIVRDETAARERPSLGTEEPLSTTPRPEGE